MEPRAHFLQRPPQPDRTHGPGRLAWAEWAKLLVFAGVIFVASGVLAPKAPGHFLARAAASVALSWLALLLWNRWRAQREQREMAFVAWLDRAAEIARQYDIHITGDDELTWRFRFRQGLSPKQAVDIEKHCSECDWEGEI